jgi:hypothetical protein
MLRIPLFIAAVTCGVALSGSMAALAAPVTGADLQGKEICWSDRGTPTYSKNGAYSEKTFGDGTWRLAGGQLTVVASHGQYTGAITKENGSFHITGSINGKALERGENIAIDFISSSFLYLLKRDALQGLIFYTYRGNDDAKPSFDKTISA